MARTVEDSDDEFPDIAQLVKRSTTNAVRKPKDLGATKKLGKFTTITKTKNNDKEEEHLVGKEGENQPENPTSRLKKRVLNATSDNPLLLPITSKTPKIGALRASRTLTATITKDPGSNKSKISLAQHSTFLAPEASKLKSQRIDNSRDVADGGKSKQNSMPMNWDSKPEPEPKESDDSDGLSEFIVNDSAFSEEDSSVSEPPLPRSTRKLVRRRKPGVGLDSDGDDLNLDLQKLSMKDEERHGLSEDCQGFNAFMYVAGSVGHEHNQPNSLSRPYMDPGKHHAGKQTSTNITRQSSPKFDDPFLQQFLPSEHKGTEPPKQTRFTTPPGSPEMKAKGLRSPNKAFPRIPMTPHRPSMDSFWQQDVINDWNDEYSPKKALKVNPKLNLGDLDSLMDSLSLKSPRKSPMKQEKVAKETKKAFSQSKHAMAQEFLIELDNKITAGQISKLAEGTGGVKIIWSKKLNTTAGRANWKRETIKSKVRLEDGSLAPSTYRHHASIELAEKVIDDEDRLLNVIAHEFCHLANFMVSNIKTNPHGKEFKAWAAKCSRYFGYRGIEVTTKHSYSIDYKYVWECENCGLQFKRHSKSIDPTRHQCGSCKSKLVQTKPVPRAGTGTAKVSEYQLFVKENMKKVRLENPGSPQKEIMGLVGKKYQEYKALKLGEKGLESVSVERVIVGKEGTPEDDDEKIGYVARKLNFSDLTSP